MGFAFAFFFENTLKCFLMFYTRCVLQQQPRKLHSHIIGVHLYSSRPQSALQFYSYVFQAASAAAGRECRTAQPQMLLRSQSPAIAPLTIEAVESHTTTPREGYDVKQGHTPRWALKVTVSSASSRPLSSFASGLPRETAAPHEIQSASSLEVLRVDAGDETLRALHSAQLCAPFSSQPAVTGVLNWVDLVVDDGTEASTALAASTMFHWRRTTSILFPSADGSRTHQYITALNAADAGGTTENRDKLCGIVPRSVLLPKWTPSAQRAAYTKSLSTVMPFFAVPNVAALRAGRDVAVSLGGLVHTPEIDADGLVTLLQDAEGLPFALFARSDEWNGVKSTTVVTKS
jgi:predicted enzyme related to lactoylglutathione lyase